MIVYDQNRESVDLKNELGAGGEGTVYRISHTECAKIYAKPSAFKEAKIVTMIENPPHPLTDPKCRNGRVAWPTRALYERPGGRFVGYVMPLIRFDRYQESEVVFIEKLRTKTYGQRFTYEHLMIAAYNFAMTVHYIHQAGHSVGDLREKNILVDELGQVCLVDCDSFQIMDKANRRFFASQTYTPAYLAPEWIGKDLAHANRRSNDRFALGVWIFQMLMNGMHPYQAKGGKASHAPSLSEKIKKGTYPYVKASRIQPPPAAPDFNQVPKSLRTLFTACFVKGHRNPDARPEAMDYARILKREIGRLKSCKLNRYHRYSGDRIACPFCQKAEKRGGHAITQPRRQKVHQKINSQRLTSALQATQPKPVTPSTRSASFLSGLRSQLSGMRQSSWYRGYKRKRSTLTSGRTLIQNLSAALLIVMLSTGVFGLFNGAASLVGSAASGFAEEIQPMREVEKQMERPADSVRRIAGRIVLMPSRLLGGERKVEVDQKVQETSTIEVIPEKEFLEGLQIRAENAGKGSVEVIEEEAFLAKLESNIAPGSGK